jgi:hypothetical protein
MGHFSGHFEEATTFLPLNCPSRNLRGQKSLGLLKMSLEMAHKVIVPQKKIMSRSFLNSGTLIVKNTRTFWRRKAIQLLPPVHFVSKP